MKRLLLFGSLTLAFAIAGASVLIKEESLLFWGIVLLFFALGFAALTIREALTKGTQKDLGQKTSRVGIAIAILAILCVLGAIIINCIHNNSVVSNIGWIIATCCGFAYVIIYVISRNGKNQN